MARGSPEAVATAEGALALLQQLFPSTDPAFLRSCISHHQQQHHHRFSTTTAAIANVVERVSDKLLESETAAASSPATREEWPLVRWWKYDDQEEDCDDDDDEEVEPLRQRGRGGNRGTIAARQEVRSAFDKSTGAGAARDAAPAPPAQRRRGRRVPDLTTERNLALIRLHRIFPTVPISSLREMILSFIADSNADIGPFALWEGVETLLLRRAKEEQEARRRRRRKEQRGDSIPWWKDVVAGLAGFGLLPSSRTSTPSTSAAAAAAGPVVQEEDPVLTAHDLFHSQSYDAALVDHFESLFFLAAPASSIIRRPRIERLVRQQGGSYASLRQRFEAMVLEAGGGGDDEDEGGGGDWGRGARGRRGGAGVAAVAKWWKRLVRIEAQEEEARAMTPPTIPRRGGPRRHPFLNREIEAFERAARPVPGSSSRSTAVTPIVAAADENKDGGDDDNCQADEDHFECQCCFSSSEPSSPETRFSCEHVDDDHNKTKHSFCLACVRSLAQNYAFGETPLSTGSLERFALPCMAATTPDEPCSGMIGREELCRALDEQLLGALERRMTETVLERFAAAATTPRRRDGSDTTLVRCPFCPYAEAVDPQPGPLVETFCPAWVREPFPPSASDILRSLLGTLILLPLLAITLALLVLVTPARRLERTYDRVVAAATASSSPPSVPSSTSLTLLDRLIVEPRLLPAIVLAHLTELCERVRARRRGQRTVFRCRNVGAARGGRRARWEVVMRMDALDARALGSSKNAAEEEEEEEEEEERDPYVEERRRQRLARFVWGAEEEEEEGLREAADSLARPTVLEGKTTSSQSCGRVSCLLCHAALNPAAPSLHTCRAGTSSSSSATTPIDSNVSPQERAEEGLRLAVEKAMNAAVVRECARCGAGLTKKGGEGACNKVTCRCGFAYCHVCLGPISSWDGYRHFCPHPHPRDPLHPNQCPEPGCTKCSLWIEPDLAKRRREAADRAREQWAGENPEWAETVAKSKPLRAVGADSHLVPFYETTLDYYARWVEFVARIMLA